MQSLWWAMFGCMSHNYLDTLCLLNHSTWPAVHMDWTNFFLGLSYPSYGLGISLKMTKCAISTFVTKYSFYGILYPYSVRHNIRTIQPIFMKFWQELKQLINLVLNAFLLIAKTVNMLAPTVRERRFLPKSKIRAIVFPYLAEHNLLTVQPIFMRFLY